MPPLIELSYLGYLIQFARQPASGDVAQSTHLSNRSTSQFA